MKIIQINGLLFLFVLNDTHTKSGFNTWRGTGWALFHVGRLNGSAVLELQKVVLKNLTLRFVDYFLAYVISLI